MSEGKYLCVLSPMLNEPQFLLSIVFGIVKDYNTIDNCSVAEAQGNQLRGLSSSDKENAAREAAKRSLKTTR